MIFYLCAAMTLISSTVSLGFSFQALFQAKTKDALAQNNAKYAISRSVSLWILSLAVFIFPSTLFLIIISSAMIMVQLLDGIIGIKISRFKTIGPLLTATVNLILLLMI
ncbi:hypothetical protein ABC628_09845 [Lentilactobacillus otakiensis]|uniref:Integral membrane protein n=1 Tax=Lentilactobacillus otakiensis DSM 19908 = JCM 15040 TaxID=1423780 RepID=S4PN32_9LACO|nr:hypothetical protein [Lentilactobacillus otakiensis]KRL09343.1 hypothetical protein FD05_GL001440 [Lentilactobacillus otakiensis DSM 19908 = JCM 15040]MDV3517517.1 hypothetical protein [Lentilactobacillus otakiensis]GAD15650.1 hypothetical protein LOT_0188 [Lentilactobacillus otakiensis DSM 19908 = JCM 15040]